MKSVQNGIWNGQMTGVTPRTLPVKIGQNISRTTRATMVLLHTSKRYDKLT